MCYNVKFLTQKKLKYAKRKGDSPDEIEEIENTLVKLTENKAPQYCVSGFTHPELLVFTVQDSTLPQLFSWGLIPSWIKDKESAYQIRNKTLNARVETLFEKPSYKHVVGNQRCLIMVDGFYEHYYFRNKAYPHYIFHPAEEPMVMAGLWDVWTGNNGKAMPSVTIVTTKAEGVMKRIHNNPKLKEGRMPLILNKENQNDWVFNIHSGKDLKDFVNDAPGSLLESHPVYFIQGKKSLGNVPAASEFFPYAELSSGTLF